MIVHGDSLHELKTLDDDSIDFVCTDPPYGYSFMGKDWDRAVPSVEIWRECLRVLKPGAFMCVMSAPRSDVQNAMISRLMEAGFRLDFTPIYWTYASGFPKAGNIGKLVDKRLGAERERLPMSERDLSRNATTRAREGRTDSLDTVSDNNPVTDQAKALDGSYAGFQPKPAVEVIIVAMKPLSEKTYVDQALSNGHGISWLDDGRIPITESVNLQAKQRQNSQAGIKGGGFKDDHEQAMYNTSGRFPANLLVSDDVLNDGVERKSGKAGVRTSDGFNATAYGKGMGIKTGQANGEFGDSGSYSRYFDLDKWAQTLPFLITPKASKSEKNKGLEDRPEVSGAISRGEMEMVRWPDGSLKPRKTPQPSRANHHPTTKPLKLMSYLITLFSRPGDFVLDPFVGSGTTCVAAHNLGRETIGIERELEYVEIARARLAHVKPEIAQLPAEQPTSAQPPVTIPDIVGGQLRLV